MLVLTRRAEQSVVVGGCAGFQRMLKVTVLEIKGSQVRLGFVADADVPIHRWEVWERILACAQADSPPAGLTASGTG